MLVAPMVGMLEERLRRLRLPLSLTLWNGRTIQSGDSPELRLTVRSPQALVSLIKPSLGKIARSYVEGDLDLDGDIRKSVRIGEQLVAGDAGALPLRTSTALETIGAPSSPRMLMAEIR